MHILSPETDNCPSWISGRERMTVENISWSISTKEYCRPPRGLNPRPPGLQSDGASNWATEAGTLFSYSAHSTENIHLKRHIPIGRVKIFFQPKHIDIFFISPQKHMLWYSLELPRWGNSNEYHNICLHGYLLLRKHAYSNTMLPPKTENFQIKNWYFSYFCSKHRLCVLIGTASVRQF